MYDIVFHGLLLDGFEARAVRVAVAARLGLGAAQLERLFCGQRVTLKRGLGEESARRYLAVLRGLGLQAEVQPSGGREIMARFKLVYWGGVVQGFTRPAVMAAAVKTFRLPPSELLALFSGNKAVLKRGLSARDGAGYIVRLAHMGMLAELEVERAGGENPAPATARAGKRPGHRQLPKRDAELALLRTEYELPRVSASVEEFDRPAPVVAPRPPSTRAQATVAGRPALSPAVARPVPDAYTRCAQCGHRQPLAARCKVCGSELVRRKVRGAAGHRPLPMDASAHGAPTTVLGGQGAPAVQIGRGRRAAGPEPAIVRFQISLSREQVFYALAVGAFLAVWFWFW
ncbi:MAG: hypothetical protein CGU28_03960 [Candidatus Dactylopiibacterium carminicum]|uniref:Zinc ribbon domain-containing protein n=1 Tax=Candidatus Dactylopiibacterium carminicum TaxID=857335 RepID=A0A272EYT2_9RHOO|nr:zinc ribbon domain-containing protein [Candidatus Dactylopiibacterium carminicum]KAF7600202.1 zinc ribbon domain-containing protein [Candidatus Dactylopiibacterium carminicum]PAS94780.1 MAG: hypothetical protein CGU29_02420 [Candidatus Dactylopiibacterium carminicum]PAS97704.1 MAG: hypothetical protein CGU28_03960 [Candidatus Dactylopiibacterium carminicum]PAT00200.1 MAG: hypothetical protein BSR46_03910 [Candidatus Dactylopiibacterium carminicum]